MKRSIFLLLIAAIATTCATKGGRAPETEPSVRLPYTYTVLFSDELEAYGEEQILWIPSKPNTTVPIQEQGIWVYCDVQIGKILTAALFESVSAENNAIAWDQPWRETKEPVAGEYDRIIKFQLLKDKCGFSEGGIGRGVSAPTKSRQRVRVIRFRCHVLMETFDGANLELLRSIEIDGVGDGRHKGRLLDDEDLAEVRKEAIKNAITDAKEKISKLLRESFAERSITFR